MLELAHHDTHVGDGFLQELWASQPRRVRGHPLCSSQAKSLSQWHLISSARQGWPPGSIPGLLSAPESTGHLG